MRSLTTEAFLRRNRASLPLPAMLRERLSVTTQEFAVAVSFLFLAVAGVTAWAARAPSS